MLRSEIVKCDEPGPWFLVEPWLQTVNSNCGPPNQVWTCHRKEPHPAFAQPLFVTRNGLVLDCRAASSSLSFETPLLSKYLNGLAKGSANHWFFTGLFLRITNLFFQCLFEVKPTRLQTRNWSNWSPSIKFQPKCFAAQTRGKIVISSSSGVLLRP